MLDRVESSRNPMLMDPEFKDYRGDDFFADANTVEGFRLVSPKPLFAPNNLDDFFANRRIGPSRNGNPALVSIDSAEDSEIFSDIVHSYISRMLMEEDIDEKVSTYLKESAPLLGAEKAFYDILGQKYPPPLLYSESPDDNSHGSNSYLEKYRELKVETRLVEVKTEEEDRDFFANRGIEPSRNGNPAPVSMDSAEDSEIFSDIGLSYISRMLMEEDVDEKVSAYQNESTLRAVEKPFYDILGQNRGGNNGEVTETQPEWQFRKGVEEARKLLPSDAKLVIDLEKYGEMTVETRLVEVKAEEEEEDRDYSINGSRGRKNPYRDDLDLEEGRSSKQLAVSSEDTIRSEMFDSVLLCYEGKCNDMIALRESLQKEASKNLKSRGKKQRKKEVVDLITLLIRCAQAVAADDRRSANELLNQIRQHSSAHGDGSQRLAHCFAHGLEARLAGTGSQIYHSLVAKRTSATNILKAYHLYLAACPFKKISHFYANQTILNLAENASMIHIVDFGIYFGFQWPCLIQRLSTRAGGPPKLRITGIDAPQPGFRPTELIGETGQRLADYARSFNVPFEYHPIASKWETIRVEDLKIDKDEVLVVNCLYRFRNLVDETVVADSPRNKVLNTIRRMNPDAFIHGIVNGSYSAPFFVTRFREALFHFSALFDMLETSVPREDEQRLLIERDLFGREALNVVSCEGSERVERPETYKQWQVRNLRAGFEQLALDPEIMQKARDKVKGSYHKDFVIDEDRRWLLQGWKGRIIYALATWKPKKARSIHLDHD